MGARMVGNVRKSDPKRRRNDFSDMGRELEKLGCRIRDLKIGVSTKPSKKPVPKANLPKPKVCSSKKPAPKYTPNASRPKASAPAKRRTSPEKLSVFERVSMPACRDRIWMRERVNVPPVRARFGKLKGRSKGPSNLRRTKARAGRSQPVSHAREIPSKTQAQKWNSGRQGWSNRMRTCRCWI